MTNMVLYDMILDDKKVEKPEPFEPTNDLKIKWRLNFSNFKQGTQNIENNGLHYQLKKLHWEFVGIQKQQTYMNKKNCYFFLLFTTFFLFKIFFKILIVKSIKLGASWLANVVVVVDTSKVKKSSNRIEGVATLVWAHDQGKG